MSANGHIYEFGPFRLDPVERLLLRDGQPVPLQPRVLKLLLVLVENAGHVLAKEELLKQVWVDSFVEESNLTVSIFALRNALGENRNEPRYVETVPRLGYRFVATVKEVENGNGRPQSEALVGQQTFSAGKDAITSAGMMSGPELAIPTNTSSGSRVSVRATVARLAILAVALGILYGSYKLLTRKQSLPGAVAPFQKLRLTRITNTGDAQEAVITPDGKYIVYTRDQSGQQSLWIRQVDTSSNVQIVALTDPQYWGLTVSRDGNYVYYLRTIQNGTYSLYRVPILGGVSTEIVSQLDSRIALSPDGKRMAFVRRDLNQGASILLVANADGSGEQTLATRRSPDFLSNSRPAWSPDGKIIACVAGSQTGGYKMFLVEVQTENGAEQIVSKEPAYPGHLVWLSDSKGLIVLGKDHLAQRSYQIWYVSHPDGKARRITNDLVDYNGISQTADSTALAAVQTNRLSSMWVMTPGKEGRERQVATGTYDGDGSLVWMPDGRIVYTSNSGGNQDIWIMNADGTGRKQLTSDRYACYPTIAPDGQTIVFVSYTANTPHIWKMNADGSSQQQLTNDNGETSPHCSPNGKFVVYSVLTGDAKGLWKVQIDGGVPVKLAGGSLRMPGISPDGKQIAYIFLDNQSGGRWRLGIMPIQGAEPTKVFDLPSGVDPRWLAPIRWTPDGRALTYITRAQGIPGVWTLPLDGNKPKQLAAFKGERIYWYDWSPDGKQLLYTRTREISDVVLIEDLKD